MEGRVVHITTCSDRHADRSYRLVIAVSAGLLTLSGAARATELATSNEDLKIRWDNTVKYSLINRLNDQSKTILASPNNDDGDRNFDQGIVSSRLDLLSEFDVTYKDYYGFRVSGQGWYDYAYHSSRHFDNKNPGTSNHLDSNGQPAIGLSNYAKRYYYTSAEILDAFAFFRINLGERPLDVKAGRHTVYWGESLFLGGNIHGVGYSQGPLDIARAFAVPGVESKELYRPLTQISANFRPSETLSIAAQYYFDWEQSRLAESGTFLGFNDGLMVGGESLIIGGTRVRRGKDSLPQKHGEYGVAVRWSPAWAWLRSGTLGFYYRNFANKLPQVYLQRDPTGARPLTYALSYGDEIDLFGISLSRNFGDASVGAEFSYRRNMPLVSSTATAVPEAFVGIIPGAVRMPGRGEAVGAVGNTFHGLVNAVLVTGENPLWDSMAWAGELTWSHWDKVTRKEHLFLGRKGYPGIDKPTKDVFGISLNLTPTWFEVFPSVTLSAPLSVSYTIDGDAAVSFGGNEDTGTYSIGLSADFRQRHRFDLKYVDYFGKLRVVNGVLQTAGTYPLYKDRGHIAFTYKTNF